MYWSMIGRGVGQIFKKKSFFTFFYTRLKLYCVEKGRIKTNCKRKNKMYFFVIFFYKWTTFLNVFTLYCSVLQTINRDEFENKTSLCFTYNSQFEIIKENLNSLFNSFLFYRKRMFTNQIPH